MAASMRFSAIGSLIDKAVVTFTVGLEGGCKYSIATRLSFMNIDNVIFWSIYSHKLTSDHLYCNWYPEGIVTCHGKFHIEKLLIQYWILVLVISYKSSLELRVTARGRFVHYPLNQMKTETCHHYILVCDGLAHPLI